MIRATDQLDRLFSVVNAHKTKLDYLQIGRGLAALYVVLFHAQGMLPLSLNMDYELQFFSAGHSGVEFFFVLSGFIISLVHWRDIGRPARAPEYFFSRIMRIYPIYWLVLALSLLVSWRFGLIDVAAISVADFLGNMFLLPRSELWLLPVAWTLAFEIFFYLFMGFCVLTGRFGLVLMGFWLALSAARTAYVLAVSPTGDVPGSFVLSHYHLLFGAGLAVAALYRNGSTLIRPAALAIGLVVFLAATFFDPGEKDAMFSLIYGCAAALMIAGAIACEKDGARQGAGTLMLLGNASYSIYLIHLPAMVVIAAIMKKLGIAASLAPIVALGILAVLSSLAGLTIYLLFEKPMLKAILRIRKARFGQTAAAPRPQ